MSGRTGLVGRVCPACARSSSAAPSGSSRAASSSSRSRPQARPRVSSARPRRGRAGSTFPTDLVATRSSGSPRSLAVTCISSSAAGEASPRLQVAGRCGEPEDPRQGQLRVRHGVGVPRRPDGLLQAGAQEGLGEGGLAIERPAHRDHLDESGKPEVQPARRLPVRRVRRALAELVLEQLVAVGAARLDPPPQVGRAESLRVDVVKPVGPRCSTRLARSASSWSSRDAGLVKAASAQRSARPSGGAQSVQSAAAFSGPSDHARGPAPVRAPEVAAVGAVSHVRQAGHGVGDQRAVLAQAVQRGGEPLGLSHIAP